MLTAGTGKRFHSQAAAGVITIDKDMDASLRDRLVRSRILNNVVTGGQTASTSFNIPDNKRNSQWLLKQS